MLVLYSLIFLEGVKHRIYTEYILNAKLMMIDKIDFVDWLPFLLFFFWRILALIQEPSSEISKASHENRITKKAKAIWYKYFNMDYWIVDLYCRKGLLIISHFKTCLSISHPCFPVFYEKGIIIIFELQFFSVLPLIVFYQHLEWYKFTQWKYFISWPDTRKVKCLFQTKWILVFQMQSFKSNIQL